MLLKVLVLCLAVSSVFGKKCQASKFTSKYDLVQKKTAASTKAKSYILEPAALNNAISIHSNTKSKPDPRIVGSKHSTNRQNSNNSTYGGKGNVLFKGKGYGSYYYDTTGKTCPGEAKYPENNGIATCESYYPGPNQKKLIDRGTNNIVAMASSKISNDRSTYCGKRVKVYHNGVLVPTIFVVWDACGSCEENQAGTIGPRLDFSMSALKEINPNACADGLTPNISWEVVDEQVIPFVV